MLASMGPPSPKVPQLEGCGPPESPAELIRALRQRSWRDVTPADIGAAWPYEMKLFECGRDCFFLDDRWRIIDNVSECGQVFEFAGTPTDPNHARLARLVVRYSARTYGQVVRAANTLLSSTGYAGTTMDLPPQPPPTRMAGGEAEWNAAAGQFKMLIHVTPGQRGHALWTLYMHLERQDAALSTPH